MKKIIFILLLLILLLGCKPKLFKVTETRQIMGTDVTITVVHSDTNVARAGLDSAFDEFNRINDLMSAYKEDSEVSILNKEGVLRHPSEDLKYNIEQATYYSDLSNGSFDITVQPLLDLWKKARTGKIPTDEEIKAKLRLVNYEDILVHEDKIEFRQDKMAITLGAIAKGYATDQAINILKENGIENALVNAGGDLKAIGKKGSQKWTVALQNPRDKSDFITNIIVEDMAVTTSGDYERYFIEKQVHHIMNPKTGYSANELISVTIIAESAMDADALSTTVFVMGPEEGLKLIESTTGVEGLLITSEKDIIRSSGWKY